MIITKYVAKTEKEAIEMAKNDLGSDAIVMNIKKIKPKGFFKLFVKPKVEVTAALDDVPNYEETKMLQPESVVAEPAKADTEDTEQMLRDKIQKLEAMLEQQVKENHAKSQDDSRTEGKETPEEQPDKDQTISDQEDPKTVACKELIHKQLLQNEVDAEIADAIMEEVDKALPRNASVDQILAAVYQRIILMMGHPYSIQVPEDGKTKYVFFLGPTGVGKTTTIAKIASALKLEKKANIALVTADTYRIAAVEQLKTYANILSVPLHVIYSPDELDKMQEQLQQFDICLIDTAGRSHKNAEQIADIRNLIEQVPISQRQVYLVLNAGIKYSDLQEIAKVYGDMTDFSLIFTKLDETSSAGAMLNMRVKTKCPLSYVTWGQNVPDDIGEVNAQKVAKELLGGNNK